VIGVVGHGDLTAETLERLEPQLRLLLERFGSSEKGVLIRAGAGLPLAVARAARSAGLPVVVVLPSRGAVPLPLGKDDAVAAGEMLVLAEHARLMDFDPQNRDECVTADEGLVRNCRRIVAVWDGSRTTSRDATAHLVAYARGRGVPVEIVWPPDSARAGTTTADMGVGAGSEGWR
jgi:hypothetical protein